jgi:hypothetical protein
MSKARFGRVRAEDDKPDDEPRANRGLSRPNGMCPDCLTFDKCARPFARKAATAKACRVRQAQDADQDMGQLLLFRAGSIALTPPGRGLAWQPPERESSTD